MNDTLPEPKRPVFGIVALMLLASLVVIPIVGYQLTSSAIDNAPKEGQVYGGLIQLLAGILLVSVLMALAGLGAAITGGIALSRGERQRWAGWLGLIGGGLMFTAVAGTALYLYVVA